MYTESLVKLGKVRSEIREIFEYGIRERLKSEQRMFLILVLVIQVYLHQKV